MRSSALASSLPSAVPNSECLPTGGTACFDYEFTLEDLGPCDYETTPNDDFANADVLPEDKPGERTSVRYTELEFDVDVNRDFFDTVVREAFTPLRSLLR